MFIDTYHSRVGFAPDMLSICKQRVNAMEWETASQQNNEDLWNTLTGFPCGSQTCLTHDDLCHLLQNVEKLILRRIVIHTDTCTLDLQPYGDKSIILILSNGEAFVCHATPCFEAGASQTVQVLRTALFFLPCQTMEDAAKKLAKMQMLGMATRNLPCASHFAKEILYI